MRVVGIVILILGIVGAAASMTMDVSVVAGNGVKVNNIGLMADKQNYLIVSGFIAIAGLLITLFGDRVKVQSGDVMKETHDVDPNTSRLDGVPVKLPIIIFIIVFALIIGSIVVFRS